MVRLAIFIFFSFTVAFASEAAASKSLIGVALFPPAQVPDSESEVTGLRFGLFGKHSGVYGIDLGLVGNATDNEFQGLAISGIFNRNYGETTIIGLQAALVANINAVKSKVYGFQIALVNINTQSVQKEFITGFGQTFGSSYGSEYGAEVGAIYGAQIGIYNSSAEVYGFQIGLVNFAKKLHGLQIGLLNFNSSGPFNVCPFFNVGF